MWDADLNHPYNARVVRLLGDRYYARYPSCTFELEEVEDAIEGHLSYLKGLRRTAISPPSVATTQNKTLRDNAAGRQNQKSSARVAFIINEGLAAHFWVLGRDRQLRPATQKDIEFLFSTDCTSSDERDPTFAVESVFRVRRLAWRDSYVSRCVELIDQCIQMRSAGSAGSNPRKRIVGDEEARYPPRHLPENWLTRRFLDGLSDVEVLALDVRARVEVDWPAVFLQLQAMVDVFRKQLDGKIRPIA
ncbi:hypothetical protein AURDEDRAFT_177797 [Auricularia subglabra TFB-10046 SS5]|uniref:Uncharacterized protein n=1 Tax=Auricularia subglabra (strain TFB-10046 / SS5) TaxID=717982 RepID=J0D379_AURST|nr:hypothetical protein AURDEDRAFT_177797 [Auricularia subglabra TFB-10046 SS5]